ncbi:MAG: hypothetical protein GY798_00025, partial [Hyphomicrobiales bacterium]|nr:hypothetical protein [Hyphomicrobiales bacterium]
MIQADDFLGHQRPDTVLRFADRARPVEAGDLALAANVWSDLASDSPRPIAKRVAQPPAGFAFLGPALRRFLEELPGRNGLSRTEATALAAVANGVSEPLRLFPEVLAREEAAFMGDFSFFAVIDDLLAAPNPLLAGAERFTDVADRVERLRSSRLSLTDAGRAVLGGTSDHVTLNGIDRYWGGTRLKGQDVWRYDRTAGHLVSPQAS